MKMRPDDLLEFRDALEPLASKAVELDNEATLPLISIAISLKRIADNLQRVAKWLDRD